MNTNVKIGLAAAGGLVCGGVPTFLVTRKVLKTKYEGMAEHEISEAREYLRRQNDKTDARLASELKPVNTNTDESELTSVEHTALDAALNAELIREGDYGDPNEDGDILLAPANAGDTPIDVVADRPEDNPILKNVFDEAKKVKVKDISRPSVEELAARDPEHPYIITTDEFFDDDNHFDKVTITFYEADNTLCDEREQFIPDVEGTVGTQNLNQFGKGEGDKNILYIRNEVIRIDYEVVRDERSYTVAVLGMDEPDEAPAPKRKSRPKKNSEDE